MRMISEDALMGFQCALADTLHFLIEPITLISCGHSVCKNCLIKEKTNLIKCKLCGEISDQDFSKVEVSKGLKQALKCFMVNIFEFLEKETNLKLNKLKS